MVARGSAGARGGPVGVAVRACAYGRRTASHPALCPGGCPASASAGWAWPEACEHHAGDAGGAW
eukprot:11691099-Alexandrium_andersonii.AAC.1